MNEVFKNFERQWFSARAFFRHIIVPWLAISGVAYLVASFGDAGHAELRRLVLVGFFSIYFLIIRSGLFIMTNNLHDDLKKEFQTKYAEQLVKHHDFGFIGLKLGATLARIKRDLYMARAEKNKKIKPQLN